MVNTKEERVSLKQVTEEEVEGKFFLAVFNYYFS
jgi:hypothetical protein